MGDDSKRHIAIVSDAVLPYHVGGKERALYEIGKRLARRGHKVDVYTMKWWSGGSSVEHDGMTYHAVMPKVALYTKDGRRSIVTAIRFSIGVIKLLRRDFQVLHVDSIPFLPLLVGWAVARAKRLNMSTTWYELWGDEYWREYLSEPAASIGGYLERLAVRAPDLILSISAMTTSRLTKAAPSLNVRTIPLGVDLSTIDSAVPSERHFDVLYAGRLLSHKGVDVLLMALDILRVRHPGITCAIIGEGPDLEKLQSLVLELGLGENVCIEPFGTSDFLYGMMKSSSVFVLPSNREGFGLVVVEANAAGIPVVTTTHSDNAAKDLIETHVNGLLSLSTPEDMALKIEEVLYPTTAWDRAVIRATASKFDWEMVTDAYELALTSAQSLIVPRRLNRTRH